MKETKQAMQVLERLAHHYGDVLFSETVWGYMPGTGPVLELKIGLSPAADFEAEEQDEAYSYLSLQIKPAPNNVVLTMQATLSLHWSAPKQVVTIPLVYPAPAEQSNVALIQQWLHEHRQDFQVDEARIDSLTPALHRCVELMQTMNMPQWQEASVS